MDRCGGLHREWRHGDLGHGSATLPWGHMAWCKQQQECGHGVSSGGSRARTETPVQPRDRRRGRSCPRSCFYSALLAPSPSLLQQPLPRERGQRWGQGGQKPALNCGERTETCGTAIPVRSRSRAVPCRVVPCRVPTPCPPCPLRGTPLFPTPTPVRGPAVRQRCARGGGGGGGDRGTLVLCHHGAPPAPRLNAALVPHRPRVSPLTSAPGPGCPQQEERDKPGDTSAARVTPLPWNSRLCPQLLASGPQTPSPPRQGWPCRWPRPREHERGTRSRFPVILGRINQAGDRCGAAAAADE